MIELIAVTFTLLSVILTVKNNILCWPTSIVGVIFYSIIFYQYNLIGDLFLQLVFFIQSIVGWYNWQNKKSTLSIGWLTNSDRLIFTILTMVLFLLILSITKYLGGNLPILDSSVTTLSIVATILLIKKRIEAWILWIINDILLIMVFSINGLNISSYIYVVFLFLAILGLRGWIKSSKIV